MTWASLPLYSAFHSNIKRQAVKLATNVAKSVAVREKKRQQEQERLEKERLRLLMVSCSSERRTVFRLRRK